MASRASASRYAKALLDVAAGQGNLSEVASGLAAVASLAAEHPDLSRAFTDPRVTNVARLGVVHAVASRLALPSPVAKLLALLAERRRLELLPEIADVFQERLLAFQNVVPAEVTSAVLLTDDQVAALAERLSRATGSSARVTMHLDPALLGGIVARIGSTVYDGSIRTQLQKVRQQLVEGASSSGVQG